MDKKIIIDFLKHFSLVANNSDTATEIYELRLQLEKSSMDTLKDLTQDQIDHINELLELYTYHCNMELVG